MATAIVDELIAVLGYKLQGQGDLKKFQAGMSGLEKSALALGATLAKVAAVAGAAVAGGLGLLGKSVISTAAQFETFAATLETIEGSADKAKASLDWIAKFARTTPYEVSELTSAFVKLKAYGIEPMDGTMTVLGDTASAMGKSLNDAVEALADATTGEFERLKEFGIVSSATKDKVTFTWQQSGKEMTRTVKKSGAEIQKFLKDVWGSKFSGAMIKQSKTWSGMMSNLKDAWSDFMRRIADGGFFENVKRRLASILETLERWNEDGTINKAATVLSDAFSWAADAIGTAFGRIKTHIKALSEDFDKFKPVLIAAGFALAGILIPAFPVIAALALLAIVVDDVLTYMQGGESITGRLVKKFWELNEVFLEYDRTVAKVAQAIRTFFESLDKWLAEQADKFVDAGRDMGKSLLEGLKTMTQDIKDWFMDLIPDWAKRYFGITKTAGGSSGGGGASGASEGGGMGIRARSNRAVQGRQVFDKTAPRILDRLMNEKGLTREQAAGVVGNLGHESAGFTAYEEGAPNRYGTRGAGWAQWTNTPGSPRRDMFENWARAQGLNPRSPEASERYLFEGDPEFAKAIEAVKRTTTTDQAMRTFESKFERAGVKHYGSRNAYARRALTLGTATAASPANDAVARYNAARDRMDQGSGTISADSGYSNNQNVTVQAPININVRDGAEAKRVAASGIGNAVKAGASVQPARMQAGPAR
jgi:hypothetical protein